MYEAIISSTRNAKVRRRLFNTREAANSFVDSLVARCATKRLYRVEVVYRPEAEPTWFVNERTGLAFISLPDGNGGQRSYILGKPETPEFHTRQKRIFSDWRAGKLPPQRGRKVVGEETPAPGTVAAILGYDPAPEVPV